MNDYTSRQLYLANGGNKLYIYKDGFGDVYSATPAEEAAWAKEVIQRALATIETEENSVTLEFAIEDLLFHRYDHIDALLEEKMQDASPGRKMVFAYSLWKTGRYEKSFDIIYAYLQKDKDRYLADVFYALGHLKENRQAKKFIIACFEGPDELLLAKAHTTIISWSVTGMSELRKNNLLDILSPLNRGQAAFYEGLAQLKKIFGIAN